MSPITQSRHPLNIPSCSFTSGPVANIALLLVAFALTSLALAPAARAVTPPPDGGYASFNTAEGTNALLSLTTGVGNTALGWNTLRNDITGQSNTASGYNALYFNTGSFNTADGRGALYRNTTGNDNTATGYQALTANNLGTLNTADGYEALASNTQGSNNTAEGGAALANNTTGANNTAVGYAARDRNTIGNANTALGRESLDFNIGGSADTGIGYQTLFSNTGGYHNTASGYQTLYFNTTGYQNTADGDFALSLNTTGNNNIALGSGAGGSLTTGSNNIDIGNVGIGTEANTIRIGTEGTQTVAYMAGISGATVAGGVGVIIDSNGHLGTSTSSARYKENIQPMEKSSEAILSLQPVTFLYKKGLDPKGIPQFGLVAEQVEKVDPDLVALGEDGKPYSVRYEAVNAMLLNEFLKEHRKVEEQGTMLAAQQKQIQALTAGLQKVSNQLERENAAVRRISNDR